MRLEEYLAQPISALSHTNGIESPWLDIDTINLLSGQFSIGDPTYFPGDQVFCECPLGIYLVQTKIMDYGSDRRFGRLRAILRNQPSTMELIGDISVDFASVGICDHPLFLAATQPFAQDEEQFFALYANKLNDAYGRIVLPADPRVAMIFVSSGWGDGGYPVYRLVAEQQIIGVEVEFIDPDEEYLFENVTEYQILPGKSTERDNRSMNDS
jgi:hypothetical protein